MPCIYSCRAALVLMALALLPDTMLAAVSAGLPASYNFGQLAVNASAPATYTFAPAFNGLTGNPQFALAYGVDFAAGSVSCTGSGTVSCTLQVAFNPRSPGLRRDALLVTDQHGNPLGTVFLYGIGLSAQIAVYPGTLTTFAGAGTFGYWGNGGPAAQARLWNPAGLAIDAVGNIFIADTLNQVVRKVSATTGVITTVAGEGAAGFLGDGGPATEAMLNNPTGVAVDSSGDLYIADQGNNRIRKVTPAGQISTVAGGGAAGSQPDGLGDGGPAINAILWGPNDVTVDAVGNLYIADSYNGLVREVNAVTGIISVVAGGGSGGNSDGLGDGGPAANAVLDDPSGVSLDGTGNLYIADTGHSLVRKVNAGSGTISVVAGNGTYGYSGDLGPAASAQLSSPVAIRIDAAGNVYIADAALNFIRVVQAASGVISTLTASSTAAATVASPAGLALDAKSDIYIASAAGNSVVELIPSPQPITYGTVNVTQVSQPFLMTVINTGNEPLAFSAVALTAGFAQVASGSRDCTASSAVLSGTACLVDVEFVPITAGVSSGTLTIASNSFWQSNAIVALSGTGASGPVPKVVLNPAAVSFGSVPAGSVGTAQTISMSNTGTATLAIGFITLTGANPGDFSVASSCAATLAVNATCTVSLVFAPAAAGTRNAVLSISDSAGNSPQAVLLSGTGVLNTLAAASPASISFGSQAVGKSGAPQSVTLTNTGNTSMGAPSVTVSGMNPGDFQIVSSCQTLLAAAASCTVSVTFTPSTAGSRAAVLSFTDAAANSPQTVTLNGSGTGTSQINVSPATLDFGVVGLDGQVTQPVTVSNNGTATVGISGTTLSGSNTDQFAIIQSSCAASLAPGQNCSLTLRFSPLLPGLLTASLIVSTASANNPAPLSLSGTGVQPFVFRVGKIVVQATFRPWDATWHTNSNSQIGSQWGDPEDIPAPADFDGDHTYDLTVFRPSTGTWLIEPSTNPGAFISQQWGQPGDVPVPADYDGDGKADLAIWRPSTGTWLIQPSTNPSAFVSQSWGSSGDVPAPGDYDGDGKTDIAIWEPSTGMWWVLPSSAPGRTLSQYLGAPGDIPVPADYDGDGKTDFAVWRPSSGYWLIVPSSQPGSIISEQFGLPGDIPVPGDYTGAGKAEIAVWRAYSGYLFPSSTGHPAINGANTQWLLTGEIP